MLKLLEEENIIKELAETENKEFQEKAFSTAIENITQKTWDLISDVNSIIATLDFEYKQDNLEEIKIVLNGVVDYLTINVGMLNKASNIININRAELIDQGEKEAEKILNNSEEVIA